MSKGVLLKSESLSKLIAESIGKALILPRYSRNDIFSMTESVEKNPLLEGIFRTYKPEKVKKYLDKRYGDAAIVQIVNGENDEKIFLIKTGDVDYNQKVIDNDMALCGYFPSVVNRENGQRTIQYEPRRQNVINDEVRSREYIYHLTPTNKVSKIFKNGLTPRTCNKKFCYPDRVYFFLNKPEVGDCLTLMMQFYDENIKKYKRGETKTVYKGSYTLLSIDTKLLKNVNFSYDPNAEKSVYTYENIPPQAIGIETEIEQEYLNNNL